MSIVQSLDDLNNTKACMLCNSKKNIKILHWLEDSIQICNKCEKSHLLANRYDYEIVRAVIQGVEIAKNNKIYLPYAVNVAFNKYSLEEAKRKNKLRNSEINGNSIDVFRIGNRQQGSFGSKQ